jgi:hypothetical protein
MSRSVLREILWALRNHAIEGDGDMNNQTEAATGQSITLRAARQEDNEKLAWLAELDNARSPVRPVLVAEAGGDLCAALSLSDDTVITDPSRPTARPVYLLRARAKQLRPMLQVKHLAPAHSRPRLRLSPATS